MSAQELIIQAAASRIFRSIIIFNSKRGQLTVFKIQKLNIIGWRDVPINSKVVGSIASKSQPIIKQVFISKETKNQSEQEFNLKLYLARKVAENKIYNSQRNSIEINFNSLKIRSV